MLSPDLPGSEGCGSRAQGLAASGNEMLPGNVGVGDADLRVRLQTHQRMGHNREGKVTVKAAVTLLSQTKGIHVATERTHQPALRLQAREEGAEPGTGHPGPTPCYLVSSAGGCLSWGSAVMA